MMLTNAIRSIKHRTNASPFKTTNQITLPFQQLLFFLLLIKKFCEYEKKNYYDVVLFLKDSRVFGLLKIVPIVL